MVKYETGMVKYETGIVKYETGMVKYEMPSDKCIGIRVPYAHAHVMFDGESSMRWTP